MTNTDLKANIDLAITNKTSAKSITPTDVGNNMKDVVDYSDQQDLLSVHLTGTESIDGLKIFELPVEAAGFIVTGGLSTQFLKADGSLDSTVFPDDNNVVHLDGNETITGQKTFITDPSTHIIQIDNDFPDTSGMRVNNTNFGNGVYISNDNIGIGLNIDNEVDGIAIGISNQGVSSGILINNLSTGAGVFVTNIDGSALQLVNTGIGVGSFVRNEGTGTGVRIDGLGGGDSLYIENTGGVDRGIIINNSVSNTGTPLTIQKDLVTKFKVEDTGIITSQGFIKEGGLASEFLMADGSTTVGYKVYTAIVSQAASSAPVPIILNNTTGATLTWTYVGLGQYRITASLPIFTVNKTIIFANLGNISGYTIGSELVPAVSSTTICDFLTSDGSALANDILLGASLEIRIYN